VGALSSALCSRRRRIALTGDARRPDSHGRGGERRESETFGYDTRFCLWWGNFARYRPISHGPSNGDARRPARPADAKAEAEAERPEAAIAARPRSVEVGGSGGNGRRLLAAAARRPPVKRDCGAGWWR